MSVEVPSLYFVLFFYFFFTLCRVGLKQTTNNRNVQIYWAECVFAYIKHQESTPNAAVIHLKVWHTGCIFFFNSMIEISSKLGSFPVFNIQTFSLCVSSILASEEMFWFWIPWHGSLWVWLLTHHLCVFFHKSQTLNLYPETVKLTQDL